MNIQKAGAKDHTKMAETLAQAFNNDPVFNYFIRQDIRREQAFRKMFEMCIRLMSESDELYITDKIEGVALWSPSEKWQLSFFQEMALLPTFLRICGLSRLGRINNVMNMTKKSHPSCPHMYLFAIGVLPDQRGKGIGSNLMRHMLDRCDNNKIPAYLENSNEANLHLYISHKFKVIGEIQVSPDAPKLWLMWRDPQ